MACNRRQSNNNGGTGPSIRLVWEGTARARPAGLPRFIAAVLCLAVLASVLAGCGGKAGLVRDDAGPVYIPAPYSVEGEDELTAGFLDPVFHENEDGPTIGTTLLGVVQIEDRYFRDLNGNQELDEFEDWRLDARTRAEALARALSVDQLTHQVVSVMNYSPISVAAADVVDSDGNPVWSKVYMPVGGFGVDADRYDVNNIPWLDRMRFHTYVMYNNPETEVAVWFNNGLEQYSEFDAIRRGEAAVPFFAFTNPVAHGMPSAEGIAAAALGDGDAGIALADAGYSREIMWAKGIDGLYGPQVDLVTDPRWTRASGSYGEREEMAAEIARNLVIGYQNGDQGMVPGSILVTVKHFPGEGATYNGFESHGPAGRCRVYSTEDSLADYQLKPFLAALEAGAAGVMPGYSQPADDARTAPQSFTYHGKNVDARYGGPGNAFNESVLSGLLRGTLGFDGLVVADSLSLGTQYGVEDLSPYERMVRFIKAGCDCGVILFDPLPEYGGSTNPYDSADAISPADLLAQALDAGDLTRADLERTAVRRLEPQIRSGNLDNPYRDLEKSVKAVKEASAEAEALAGEANLKSVVLMKNGSGTLPLAGQGKRIFVREFSMAGGTGADSFADELESRGFTVVDDYGDADIAYLRVKASIGVTGSNVLGVLDLVENVESPVYGGDGRRTGESELVSTVRGMDMFRQIADAVHGNGGTVIGEIAITSPWILGGMEPYCDALIGTFGTADGAVAAVVAGDYAPTGKLPVTMAADASVIELSETELDGEVWDVCASPNDVPGYGKDQYMDDAVLARSPSGSYAYRDADGNMYVSGFGLSY